MKILVADDSPVMRMAVTKLLEPEGYEVVTAEDGVEAIRAFYRERPDLVLLDIQMPKLNGYVVCRLIKGDSQAAHTPVLILTVRTANEDRYWGVKSGADGYLTKEELGDDLLRAIRSALASRALRELSTGEIQMPEIGDETDVLTRVCEMLDRKLFEATIVNEITSISVEPVSFTGAVGNILEALYRLVAFDFGGIVTSREAIVNVSAVEWPDPADVLEFQALVSRHYRDITGIDIEPGDFQIRPHREPQRIADAASGWGSVYAVPLKSRGQSIGLLVVAAHRADVFTEGTLRTLHTVTPSIAAVVESARAYQANLEDEARATFSSLF